MERRSASPRTRCARCRLTIALLNGVCCGMMCGLYFVPFVVQEETSALLKEMEALQLRVHTLEAQVEASSSKQLLAAQLQGVILHESIRSQQLSLATAQSVVSGFLVRSVVCLLLEKACQSPALWAKDSHCGAGGLVIGWRVHEPTEHGHSSGQRLERTPQYAHRSERSEDSSRNRIRDCALAIPRSIKAPHSRRAL